MEQLKRTIHNPNLRQIITKKLWTIQQSNSENLFDGAICVENDDLIINPPRGFGNFPIIMAGENVEILWNGNKVDHPLVVHDLDDIEVHTLDTLPRVDIEIELAEDNLTAHLTVTRIKGRKYALIDARPMNQLKVMARCVEEEEPEALDYNQIINILHEKGIVYGIQNEAILQAIHSSDDQITVEAAKGLFPVESTDATIVYNFESTNASDWVLNPFGGGKIHSVSVGAIVAIKKLPCFGVPGIDVMGQPVLPKTPKDMPILIRDGVKLIKEDTVAVATRSGRPVLEGYKKKYLSVRPVHVVQGDVDIKVGNIDFNGDVIVTGSVLDGFTVKAGGSIQVYGDVMHASLFANGDITINKKAMTAKIRAGGSTVPYKRIYQLLNELSERIDNLCVAIQTIKTQPSFSTLDLQARGDGQLIQLLLDYKFKDVPKLVQQLVDQILKLGKSDIVAEVITTASLLSQKLCNLGPMRIQQSEEINQLLEEIIKTNEVVDGLLINSSNISVGYVQNCDLQASGDICITKQGAITSRVEAEGSITIPNGNVRGGELIAREHIKVLELGSTRDAEIHVRLLEDCTLEAAIVHPVVLIKYGSQMGIIQEHTRFLKAYPHNRSLVIEKA